ncbi:MAG: type II secretion system protein GspK [Rhodanobacter sp.]
MHLKRATSGESGFVLIIVLMMLVVLSLLAAATATTTARALTMAQADADRFQDELNTTNTVQTLMFMLSTQRQTVAGLTTNDASTMTTATTFDSDATGFNALPLGNEIRMDGTPYRGSGDINFSLQDDGGLLSVNWAPPALKGAFFQSLGVASDKWGDLEAKRLDYQDPDDLTRLNGAESKDYKKAGMPPPSNRTLSTPLELRRVLQWDKMLAPQDDVKLLSTLTMARSTRLNINTAPIQVLELLPGMTQKNAQRIIEVRSVVPFVSVSQAQQSFGLTVGEEWLTLFARPSGNLILWNRYSGSRQLLHWTMTPRAPAGPPWRIDYEVTLPRGAKSAPTTADSPATSLFTAQDAPR